MKRIIPLAVAILLAALIVPTISEAGLRPLKAVKNGVCAVAGGAARVAGKGAKLTRAVRPRARACN